MLTGSLPGRIAFAANKKEAKSEESKPEKSEKAEKSKEKKEKKEKKSKAKDEPQEPTAEEKEFLEYQSQLADDLKKTKTPFSTTSAQEVENAPALTTPLTLSSSNARHSNRLSEKLFVPRLYLPGRLQIGKSAQFTVRGKAGYMVALAYADRDSGAKPIFGHKLRLGPDRRVVALGKIPEGGVIALKFFAPIEGDLIGQNLYFEAALWPENHPELMELAQTVSSESQVAQANSIIMLGESEKRKGVRIVPEGAMPIYARPQAGGSTLDSGKP